jgi:hypothetical protein
MIRGEVVTRVREGRPADPYAGTDAVDAAPEVDITTLAPPEPRPSQEPGQDARNAVVSGWTLYLPAGSDVLRTDSMRVRGEVYPVQGEPAVWSTRGIVVQAFRGEG